MNARHKLIGAVHGLAKRQSLDEGTRRDLMKNLTGKDSCSKMTIPQLKLVIDHLKGQTKAKAPDHQRKIKALWLSAWNLGIIENASDFALNAFVKRQCGVPYLSWLTTEKAASVIEGIKTMMARKGVLWPRNGSVNSEQDAIINAQIRILTETTCPLSHEKFAKNWGMGGWMGASYKSKNNIIQKLGKRIHEIKKRGN